MVTIACNNNNNRTDNDIFLPFSQQNYITRFGAWHKFSSFQINRNEENRMNENLEYKMFIQSGQPCCISTQNRRNTYLCQENVKSFSEIKGNPINERKKCGSEFVFILYFINNHNNWECSCNNVRPKFKEIFNKSFRMLWTYCWTHTMKWYWKKAKKKNCFAEK